MNKKIGFIGCGNMGGAMIGGIIKSGLIKAENIMVSDLDEKKLESIKTALGINITTDSVELVNNSDIIVLAVKPNIYDLVIKGIKNSLTKDKLLVTIAAGVSLNHMESLLGHDYKIVRTMPNTPALVSEGMSALCPNKNISQEELDMIKAIFESFGKAEVVKENLIDAVIGVSGSSPAYVFMFIEAMADAAVLGGMSRDNAYKFAAQSVLGSAKMVLETGMHPGRLKDMVCSPGGTTIEAVSTLEKEGFRSSVIEGMLACMNKSKKMSGN
ncbi:pyrroline-5-carboxylate reductase [Anaeromicrobium sediminis]|uniref:Pyrroline-5-carboxylate reductase n=1 Tax=Anaeromicrobium sediminis TaxID=1478221 RepID=A0A267MKD4_9FIRM|nr:pyrroline-5-carboxylate reductase [Anaeromicrobium sediminis]PAB59253.1 pyrroline-5-carboxylate reductase [Anaeromicrobium sediminis]